MSRKLLVVASFAALLFSVSCGGGIKGLKEPTTGDAFMVIGSVFLENNYFDDRAEVYMQGIEVAILAREEVGGKTKTKGYWTTTDENGYFMLADVPPGKYTLKGIRLTMSKGTFFTITNTLRYTGSTFVIQNKETVIFDGDYFGTQPKGRIVNLEYNHFAIDRTSEHSGHVNHLALPVIKDLKVVTGETLNLPPVEQYFIDKYPQSAWVPILKKSLETK